MLDKIINVAEKSERELTFEIGSNSDLILENTITGNLVWTIKLDHKGKVIVRMSVNPEEIINKVEFGTSRLKRKNRSDK